MQQRILRREGVDAAVSGEKGGGIVLVVAKRGEQGESGIDTAAGEQHISAGKRAGEGFLRVKRHAADVGIGKQAEIGWGF